jgi:hypothetical protein
MRHLFCYIGLLLLQRAYADSPAQSWVFQKDLPPMDATLLSFAEDKWTVLPVGESESTAIASEDFRGWLRSHPAPDQAFHNVRVYFRNGDFLEGDLLHLDAETLKLRTPWQQELTLQMDKLASLEMSRPRKDLVLDGTRNLDNWKYPASVSEDEAVEALPTAGGLLIHQPVPGIMRRPLPALPDTMLLELTFQLPSPDTPYYMYLFSNAQTVYNPGTIYLRIQEGRFFIRQFTYDKVSVEFDLELPADLDSRHAYQIYVNHVTQRLDIWLNGQRIYELLLVLRDNPKEGGLWYSVSTKPGNRYFLENFRVFPWNGNAPQTPPSQSTKGDLWKITLANSDHLDATQLKIEAETFSFSLNDEAPMTVPLRVLRSVEFPQTPLNAEEPGDVLLRLASGLGRLSGKLLSLDEDNLTLHIPAEAAPLTIPRSQVDGIWMGNNLLPAFPLQPK